MDFRYDFLRPHHSLVYDPNGLLYHFQDLSGAVLGFRRRQYPAVLGRYPLRHRRGGGAAAVAACPLCALEYFRQTRHQIPSGAKMACNRLRCTDSCVPCRRVNGRGPVLRRGDHAQISLFRQLRTQPVGIPFRRNDYPASGRPVSCSLHPLPPLPEQTPPFPQQRRKRSPSTSSPSVTDDTSPEPEEMPVTYKDNVMDIDFAALAAGTDDPTLAAMHRYFGSRTPTRRTNTQGCLREKI